jgi:calcium-binding protein CML
MRDYSKQLIKKCDKNNDGIISFLELCDGLKSIGIYLNGSEREALMNRIDTNKDGYITDQEIYKVLSSIDVSQIKQVVKEEADSALKKIASGAADYPSMNDYVKTLMKKFDADSDGVITFNELCDGIKQLNIFLRLKERQALMSILDLNSDGTLTAKELLSVL